MKAKDGKEPGWAPSGALQHWMGENFCYRISMDLFIMLVMTVMIFICTVRLHPSTEGGVPMLLLGEKGAEVPAVARGTALVTGASSGVGRATAEQLALKGSRVLLACRSR